jgi:CheY-like chemotaxis protein
VNASRDPPEQPDREVGEAAAEPPPLVLTLLDVQPPLPPIATERELADDGLVRSDPEPRPVPWLGDPETERTEQRTARRAQVRRDRHEVAQAAADAPVDMLVLCATPEADPPVCALLRYFGFGVQVSSTLPALAAPWPFAAVFVDAAWSSDGGDALDLCARVRENSRVPGERKPALVLLAAQLSSTDRVRAGLAGCNEVLVGPITRGALAGALESRGIALPRDARGP